MTITGLLNQQVASDATLAFIDPDGSFAESITYIPSSANLLRGVTQKTINAIVVREVPVKQLGTTQDVQHRLKVVVANDPLLGISSALIDYGGDKVSLQYRIGETVSTHSIKQCAPQETNDPGMLTLEV